MKIHARVQHHPSRAHLIPELLHRLDGLAVEVIEHCSTPPNPWAGYRRCMAAPPSYATHLLIVQDDVQICHNFVPAVKQIAEANPDAPVCLFLGRLPADTKPRVHQAMKMGRRYVTLSWRSFLPIVAVLWPVAKLVEFREWTEAFPYLPGTREPRSDDAMAGRWKMVTRQMVRATVPSLVEHPDEELSTVGLRAQWGGKPRVAAYLADDASAFDWSMS